MESVFQNCVSEFDLNLFEQSTTGNQANPAAQCPVSRKMGIARMKNKLKGFNQVINKAQKGNLSLLEMQKELLITKQELEETRNLLFEKNEEYKVICEERSTYFNQASEYSIENQNLKEKLQKFEDMSFGAHLKDKIIEGYSEQMKGIKTEMENMVEDYKLQLKNASTALKHSKIYSSQLKKQVVRLLEKYVIPNTKERDKWLTTVMKKYISEGAQEDESEKIENPENIVEKQDETSLDGMELAAKELDCIESVDTGRGSSLGFSDGEKSFHSPDYYMDDSPHCNKCNMSRKDVSTSPVPCITSNEISIAVCKKCDQLLKKDASTSPGYPQMHDNCTDTADIEFEITSRNIDCDRNLEHGIINDITNTSEVTYLNCEKHDSKNASNPTILKTDSPDTPIKLLQDFTYDSENEDDVNSDREVYSPMDEFNTLPTTDFSEVVTKNMQVKVQIEAASDSDNDEVMQTISKEAIAANKSYMFSPIDINESFGGNSNTSCEKSPAIIMENDEAHFGLQNEKLTLVKLQINAVSDIEEDEDTHIHIENRISRTPEPCISSPENFEENLRISSNLSCVKSLKAPSNLCKNVLDSQINVSRNTQHEKEYLQSINSINNGNDTDMEIQTILDDMRLHQMISPIPATPLPSRIRSPRLVNVEDIIDIVAKQVNTYLKLISNTLVRNGVKVKVSESVEEISQLLDNELNEDDLNLLVSDTNQGNQEMEHECLPVKSNMLSNNRLPDLVDLNSNSMLVIAEDSEVEDDSLEESASLEQNFEIEDVAHVISGINNSKENKKASDKNLSCMSEKSKVIDAPVVKIETSKCFTSENTNTEPCDEILVTHETTQGLVDNETENEADSQANNECPNTSNTITSKNNIVYEDIPDSDPENIDLENSIQNQNPIPGLNKEKQKRKAKKISMLEKLRQKMAPKSKIKCDIKKSVRKQPFNPKPISLPTPKKKVTESDTAASLNDKSVYENAVNVLAQQKSAQPRIVLMDCVRYSEAQNKYEETDEKDRSSSKKRKLSEKELEKVKSTSKTPENCNIDSNLSLACKDTKKSKRTSPRYDKRPEKSSMNIKQNLDDDNRKLNDYLHEKSPCKRKPKNSEKVYNSEFQNCDSKHTHDAVLANFNYANETKRKRTYVSEKEISIKKSDCNSNIEESSNCRNLRSSTQNTDELHTKVVQSQPEQPSTYYNPIARKLDSEKTLEISQIMNGSSFGLDRLTQRDTESTQIVSKNSTHETTHKNNDRVVSSYADIDLLLNSRAAKQIIDKPSNNGRKDSLLCRMIEKYGVRKLKFAAKAPPEKKIKEFTNKLEDSLSEIAELPHEHDCVTEIKKLVAEIRTWDVKHSLVVFVKILRNPERKIELYNKLICPPAPPMTKKEEVLLQVIEGLQKSSKYRNIVDKLLTQIEYTLFALNKQAEEFDAIESMAHFYAVLCRCFRKISRLRMFIMDAMYCLQLKSVVLVQQCLDVWMNVLPMGHLGLAKCPLVTILVYMLHFYKCEDKFGRVQNIRNRLQRTYNYNVVDWTETYILDQFRTCITEISDIPMERKILRLSLLILAKRNGASWCHNNIVKSMLQPLIKDNKTSDSAKRFCISLLGPLLKPYPSNMKVHCETINNYLMDMLDKSNSLQMQEAIVSSLICLDKNNNRFHQFLANWKPAQTSYKFEFIFKNYVSSKPLHLWKKLLSWHIVKY